MLDDILDYSQSSELFEKPVLEDIKQGIYTLPLIFSIEENKEAFIPLLRKGRNMTDADINEVLLLIRKYQGIEKANSVARRYTEKALKSISQLPDRPEKEILYKLTKELFERSF